MDESERKDTIWMARALELARHAETVNEVPVGALVELNGECIGEGWNHSIAADDPTAHAEIEAMRAAARSAGNYRLTGATLYVTLEPCVMCAGAMVHARIGRLVYGAPDLKAGAAGSAFNVLDSDRLNHRVAVQGGVLESQCSSLLLDFFRRRRAAE